MAQHDPVSAITEAAAYVRTAAVLPGGSFYPAPAVAPAKSGIWRWRRFAKDEIDEQVWVLTVDLDIVAPIINESQYDIGAIDPLVVAVVDLFSPSLNVRLATADGKHVDWVDIAEGEAVRTAGYYAFRLPVTMKFRRFADG